MIFYSLTLCYWCRITRFYLNYMSCAIAFYVATLSSLSNFSYDVLTAVLLSVQVLWDVTLCYWASGSIGSNECIAFFSGHCSGH